jgi:hypothetical protein
MENLTDLSTNLVGPGAEDQQGNARSISGLRTSSNGHRLLRGGGSVHNRPRRVGESVPRQQEPEVKSA